MTRRIHAVAAILAWLVVGSSCTTVETPSAASGSLAVLKVFAEPNPVDVTRSEESEEEWQGSFVLVVQEIAGTGGTIDFIQLNLPDGQEDVVAGEGFLYPGERIASLTGTNHIDGLGELRIPMRVNYTKPSGAPQVELVAFVHLTDDRGNAMVTASAPVTFQ